MVNPIELINVMFITAFTSVAAHYMGWGDQIGSIRPGFYGDIVAVKGEPLTDIKVLEDVDTVVTGGLVFKAPADRDRYNLSGVVANQDLRKHFCTFVHFVRRCTRSVDTGAKAEPGCTGRHVTFNFVCRYSTGRDIDHVFREYRPKFT